MYNVISNIFQTYHRHGFEWSWQTERFSFAEKYEILKELDAGVKRQFLEEKHGISHGALAGFLKNRATIEASIATPQI